MSDFVQQFQAFEEAFRGAARSALSKLDQITYQMLVNDLKHNDYDVVAEVIDQLVKEKKDIAIAPLYCVSQMHPNVHVREKAKKGIAKMGKDEEVAKIVAGKPVADATKALIEKYGHYRA